LSITRSVLIGFCANRIGSRHAGLFNALVLGCVARMSPKCHTPMQTAV
jgi:hypothetical protein